MRVLVSQSVGESRRKYDFLFGNYLSYLESMGFFPIVVSNFSADPDRYFAEHDPEGIVLTGGNSVSGQLFGVDYPIEGSSEERDSTEERLLKNAIEHNLPVLGICRGMQYINAYFGGKLGRIGKDIETSVEHVAATHKVRVEEPGLRELVGESLTVNSFHGFGLQESDLASPLKIAAISPRDGVVEALYHPKLPIAGVQWHPERPESDIEADKKIFWAFLNKRLFWGD